MFGRKDVQEILRTHFVVAAADDWYQRRQDDPLGRFFRSVADQGPRKGEGGSTRQGRYAFTASGKLLGFNNNRDPQRILAMLRESLAKWETLPAVERAPGALTVPALDASRRDARYLRTPPHQGVVVTVRTRVVEQDGDGGYSTCTPPADEEGRFRNHGFAPATDHLWITAEEWRSLVSTEAPGPLVPALAHRLLRFHLVDNTRGEPLHWRRDEIKVLDLEVVPHTAPDGRQLLVRGRFHAETTGGDRGIEGSLLGRVAFDPETRACRRFDLLALADHWGQGQFTRGARPGKTPLLTGFSLTDPDAPDASVPPQGARWEQGYHEADRH